MKAFYQKLFSNFDDAFVIIRTKSFIDNSADYEILDFNSSFTRFLKKTGNELLGKSLFLCFTDIKVILEKLLIGINEKNLVSSSETFSKDYNSKLLIKAIYIDTEIKALYFSKPMDNAFADEPVIELDSKLTEIDHQLSLTKQKLIEAEKLASIGQLSAGIAHEVNNPLGFVLSNFETLKKYVSKLDDTIYSYRKMTSEISTVDFGCMTALNKAIDQKNVDFVIQDLNELINDTQDGLEMINKIVLALRSFARQGPEEIMESYDVNSGIETSMLIAKNRIKYIAEVDTQFNEIPLIEANSGQINQVFLNLIINSAQAIEQKHYNDLGKIKIKTYHDAEYVYCSIEDNGIGIDKENMNNIFKPFYTTKPVGIGTGLGLSISYDIIKNKHNGNITVDSKKDEYTLVNVKLPIKQFK